MGGCSNVNKQNTGVDTSLNLVMSWIDVAKRPNVKINSLSKPNKYSQPSNDSLVPLTFYFYFSLTA